MCISCVCVSRCITCLVETPGSLVLLRCAWTTSGPSNCVGPPRSTCCVTADTSSGNTGLSVATCVVFLVLHQSDIVIRRIFIMFLSFVVFNYGILVLVHSSTGIPIVGSWLFEWWETVGLFLLCCHLVFYCSNCSPTGCMWYLHKCVLIGQVWGEGPVGATECTKIPAERPLTDGGPHGPWWDQRGTAFVFIAYFLFYFNITFVF